jgi:DNA-binding transcriptional LysR family regulator
MIKMDLYQIRYFLAIAQTGSFTKAAERLFVSQPSLSAGIKKLEQELGVKLFERGGRRAIPTPAGKFFLEKATNILNEYQVTLRELKEFQHRPTIRLGVLPAMQIASLAGLIRDFQTQHPNIPIELLDGTIEELHEWMEEGEIDLAMTVLDTRQDSKTSLALFHQRRLLAVPENHPFARRKTVRLEELDEQPYIDRVHCELCKETRQMFESKNIHPRIVYRANREEWTLALVAAGLGLAIMPEWSNASDVVYIPIVDLSLQRTVGLVWRARHESEAIHLFCTFAVSHNW